MSIGDFSLPNEDSSLPNGDFSLPNRDFSLPANPEPIKIACSQQFENRSLFKV